MLLNRCFDDIEKYVARLQMAADAYRELELRRNTRNKGGRNAMGGTMMLRWSGYVCIILASSFAIISCLLIALLYV